MSEGVPRLVEQAQGGSTEAFEELIRLHLGVAFAVARSLVASREDAEDVVQESLVRAWQRLDQCREPGRFKSWLLAVVRSVALNHRAREKRHRSRRTDLVMELPDSAPGPERRAEIQEARRKVDEMVNALNERQRAVLLLHDIEGYSHGEIAELLQMSNESSRRYLADAKRILRSKIRSEKEES